MYLNRRGKFFVTVLASLLLFAGVSPASAAVRVDSTYVEGTDKQAFLFNPLRVNRVDLNITQANYTALANNPREYVPATMKLTTEKGATSILHVGLRLKGMWGSGVGIDGKAGFKVKMNYSVKGQKLYGIKKFTFNNMVQDQSMLHEAAAYELFRAVGVPAPRVGYVNVYLNGMNYGLHANIETYDNRMFKRWMSAKTDHLYEGGYGTEVGPDLEVDDGSLTDKSDVIAIKAINDTMTGVDWYNAIRSKVDIKEMVADWAVEHYIGHWDGYTRGWPNNYFVHKAKGGLFTMHPWGTDQTWMSWNALLDDGATMMTRCVQYQPCQELYLAALTKVELTAPKLALPTMVDRIWTAISASANSDPRKPYSFDSMIGAKNSTKDFMNNRFPELVTYNAGRKLSTLKLAYSLTGVKVESVVRSKLTKVGDGVVSYTRILGDGICDVDSITGAITLHRKGTCAVAAQSTQTATYQGQMVITTVKVPTLASRIAVTNLAPIAKGQWLSLNISKDSIRPSKVALVSGKCKVSGLSVKALASSGTCKVRVSVTGDGIFGAASKLFTLRLQ